MARKDKSAALYELLYKDKGKTTAPDGSLKMPSWWQNRAGQEGGQPHPSQTPPDEADEVAAGEEAEAPVPSAAPSAPPAEEPVEAPTPPKLGRARSQTGPERVVEPPIAPPPAIPAPSSVAAPPAVEEPTGQFPVPPPAPFRPAPSTRPFSPPWATAPWIQLADGRIKLDLSNVAALIATGAAVVMLVGVFLIGVYTGRPGESPAPLPPADVKPNLAGVDAVRNGPANPEVLNPSGNNQEPARPGNGSPGVTPTDPNARTYVIFQTFGSNKQAALDVRDYLNTQGFDMQVGARGAQDNPVYWVRTRLPFRNAEAKVMAEKLFAVMAKLNVELPGRINYDPSNTQLRPYLYTAAE